MTTLFTAGAAVVVAGSCLAATAGVPPAAPEFQTRAVLLTGSDTAGSPLGDGTALIVGGSGLPVPPPGYAEAADTFYLAPRGFGGTTQTVVTPESLWPITGVKNLTTDESFARGAQILAAAVENQIAGGHVDAANPVVVFGYSQGADVETGAMKLLAGQGVPSDDVHFVMIGDPANPDGGLLERYNVPIDGASPTIPGFGITFSGATPDDLYPTDIYTLEYDGFADYPRYPIDFLSDLNAILGMGFSHGAYLGLTHEQIADAIQLPTSAADTMTDYYMIPADSLPLLAPLQFLPVVGQPLYDLLEPDTSILVNLGYGCIDDTWCQTADASAPTTFGLFGTNLNWADVFTALGKGLQHGIGDAVRDIQNPATYQPTSVLDTPALQPLLETVYRVVGGTDNPNPSWDQIVHAGLNLLNNAVPGALSHATLQSPPIDILNDLITNVSNDYATLLPIADTVTALLTTAPAVAVSFLTQQAADGNLLGGIGEAIAAAVGLIPLGIGFGALAPVVEAAGLNLLNLVNLFPGALDGLANLLPDIP